MYLYTSFLHAPWCTRTCSRPLGTDNLQKGLSQPLNISRNFHFHSLNHAFINGHEEIWYTDDWELMTHKEYSLSINVPMFIRKYMNDITYPISATAFHKSSMLADRIHQIANVCTVSGSLSQLIFLASAVSIGVLFFRFVWYSRTRASKARVCT